MTKESKSWKILLIDFILILAAAVFLASLFPLFRNLLPIEVWFIKEGGVYSLFTNIAVAYSFYHVGKHRGQKEF